MLIPFKNRSVYTENKYKQARSTTINQHNFEYWNILKGIGALTIVLGHSCYFATAYVYLFHLALFFFVSGYLYSEVKYGDTPFLYIGNRLKSIWPRYVICSISLILLHNIFLDFYIILDQPRYGIKDMVVKICNTVVFSGEAPMGGALWFAPVLIVASGFFAGIIWFSRKITVILSGSNVMKYILVSFFSFLFGTMGVILYIKKASLNYHIHTAFLVIPIYACAWFLRVFCKEIHKLLKGCIALPLAVGLYYVVQLGWRVELSAEIIPGPVKFYLVSLSGIYVCMYAAVLIQRIPYIKTYFALMGKHSFEIMAYHFVAIKLVDLVYAMRIGEKNPSVYGVFVCAYSQECWLYYAVAATAIPVLVGLIWESALKKLLKMQGTL